MRPMKNNPCKDCVAPKRYPGCHATCPDYIIAKAFHEAEREEEYQKQEVSQYSIEFARKNHCNAVKRRKSFRGYKWRHE